VRAKRLRSFLPPTALVFAFDCVRFIFAKAFSLAHEGLRVALRRPSCLHVGKSPSAWRRCRRLAKSSGGAWSVEACAPAWLVRMGVRLHIILHNMAYLL
jgi:hypothetical protein